jgi:hypothetical protein
MNILSIIKTRGLVYILLLLTLLAAGGSVFLYFFPNNGEQTGDVSYNVDKVEIKTLNTNIFQSSQFQSLQPMPATAVDLNSLTKGKRNPFAPN